MLVYIVRISAPGRVIAMTLAVTATAAVNTRNPTTCTDTHHTHITHTSHTHTHITHTSHTHTHTHHTQCIRMTYIMYMYTHVHVHVYIHVCTVVQCKCTCTCTCTCTCIYKVYTCVDVIDAHSEVEEVRSQVRFEGSKPGSQYLGRTVIHGTVGSGAWVFRGGVRVLRGGARTLGGGACWAGFEGHLAEDILMNIYHYTLWRGSMH